LIVTQIFCCFKLPKIDNCFVKRLIQGRNKAASMGVEPIPYERKKMRKYQTYHAGEVQVYVSRKRWEILRIKWPQRLQTESFFGFTLHTEGKNKKEWYDQHGTGWQQRQDNLTKR